MENRCKKRNPFTVPDHYFDDLSERVMQRVMKENGGFRKKNIRFFRLDVKWVAIFVIGLMIVQLFRAAVSEELLNQGENLYVREILDETIFDSQFNPTTEEIIEYLAAEVDDYEGLIAGIY